MKCDKAQEFFSDYIESTLDRPMTVALESLSFIPVEIAELLTLGHIRMILRILNSFGRSTEKNLRPQSVI